MGNSVDRTGANSVDRTGANSVDLTGAFGEAKNPRMVNFIDLTGGSLLVKSRKSKGSEMT